MQKHDTWKSDSEAQLVLPIFHQSHSCSEEENLQGSRAATFKLMP